MRINFRISRHDRIPGPVGNFAPTATKKTEIKIILYLITARKYNDTQRNPKDRLGYYNSDDPYRPLNDIAIIKLLY